MHDLIELQKTFNNETVHFWEGAIVLELLKETKEDAEDVGVIAVF